MRGHLRRDTQIYLFIQSGYLLIPQRYLMADRGLHLNQGDCNNMVIFILSHSLLWRHIVLLAVRIIQATTECYIPLESVWRGDFKKVLVRLSVCNYNKKAYASIINSRKIIRISGEKAYNRLQDNEAIFSKKYFSKILDWIFEKFCTCIKCLLLHYKE